MQGSDEPSVPFADDGIGVGGPAIVVRAFNQAALAPGQ